MLLIPLPTVTNCHTFSDPLPSSMTYFMDGPADLPVPPLFISASGLPNRLPNTPHYLNYLPDEVALGRLCLFNCLDYTMCVCVYVGEYVRACRRV